MCGAGVLVRFIEALEGALVVSSARVYKRARRLSSPAGRHAQRRAPLPSVSARASYGPPARMRAAVKPRAARAKESCTMTSSSMDTAPGGW